MARRKDGLEIRVSGLRELQSTLKGIENKGLRAELRVANKSAAEVIADQAEKEAPKGPSGRLARSVKAAAGQRDATVKAGSAARVPYAGVIHFGSSARGIEANPFLYRALAKRSDEAKKVYEEKIRGLMETIGSSKFST